MSTLSPEEKNRIYEEEKIRMEAQEQLKLEAKKKADAAQGKRTLLALVFIAIAGWFIWSWVSGAVDSFTTAVTTPDTALSVADIAFKQSRAGNPTVTGTVKNSSSKKYGYVQVQFNLYDKAGAQVGSALANINNLEPNGTWKFEAIVLQDNVATARLESVSGF